LDPGSGIRDSEWIKIPGIRDICNNGHSFESAPDPGTCAFLTPVSGIRDEQPGSYFQELRINLWVKILKFFDADPGWTKFGSGMKKFGSGISDEKNSDPHTGFLRNLLVVLQLLLLLPRPCPRRRRRRR
jgi:hypothetical protein